VEAKKQKVKVGLWVGIYIYSVCAGFGS